MSFHAADEHLSPVVLADATVEELEQGGAAKAHTIDVRAACDDSIVGPKKDYWKLGPKQRLLLLAARSRR